MFFWKPAHRAGPGRARHVLRPYRDARIGRSIVSICHQCCIIAVSRYCAAQKREDSPREVRPSSGIPAGYFLPACSSSLIEISQRATPFSPGEGKVWVATQVQALRKKGTRRSVL